MLSESQEKNEEYQGKERNVTQLKYPIPSASLSFDRHMEVLKAYVVRSKEGKEPVSYKDFGSITVNPNNISSNNRFFENLGLIKKTENTIGKYVPTETAISIYNLLKWDKQDEAKKEFLRLVTNSWFGSAIKNLLDVKEKASRAELIQELGYQSGADPQKHAPALSVMLDYLTYTEFVRAEGDVFVLGALESLPERKVVDTNLPASKTEQVPEQRTIFLREKAMVQIAVMIPPEMSEERIRQVIRICLDEIGKT